MGGWILKQSRSSGLTTRVEKGGASTAHSAAGGCGRRCSPAREGHSSPFAKPQITASAYHWKPTCCCCGSLYVERPAAEVAGQRRRRRGKAGVQCVAGTAPRNDFLRLMLSRFCHSIREACSARGGAAAEQNMVARRERSQAERGRLPAPASLLGPSAPAHRPLHPDYSDQAGRAARVCSAE